MQFWLRKLLLIVLLSVMVSTIPDAVAVVASSSPITPSLGDIPYQAARLESPSLPTDVLGAPSDPRGDPAKTFEVSPASVDAAPGYCASSGGNSSYEAITSANFVQSPGGNWQVQVQVFIANPQGCVAGEECPSYDPSPEHVNGWIDWNGNKTWEPSEQVINTDLTGYLGINYQGTMTAIAQFSQPDIITDTTWARVNLGWSYDPNDPCTPSWDWGNVLDQELNIGGPKIKEIKVTGSKDADNPMTTYDVNLQAVMDTPPGYEITKVSWSGDLKAGEGNPYTYKPDKGTHGLKKIKATATYRYTPTGATGQVAKEFEFKLFFEKKGDDDGDGEPNWFDYWGTDSSVAGLTNPSVRFDSTKGAGQYGSWNPATDKVDLGAAAAEIHYPGGLNIDGTVYGNVKGIDSVSEVIGHELRHRTTNHNWKAGGSWVGQADSDLGVPNASYWDLLPDTYEDSFGTDKTKTDSKDLEHKKSPVYKYYGDNEFDAIVAGNGFRGVADKDWANPGSQSKPAFKTLVTLAAAPNLADSLAATSGPVNVAALYAPTEDVLPGLVALTGNYTDSGVDANSDSKLEALRISVELNVTAPGSYSVVGWIQDSGGHDVAWAQKTTYLNSGIQKVNLDFNGALLYAGSGNLAYTLSHVEVRGGEHSDLVAAADNAYVTASYARNSFIPPAVTFTNSYADAGKDTGSDGLFDQLNIDVGVTIHQPGTYSLVGWLYDNEGNQIPGASASVAFNASGTKKLTFDGQSIRWSRKDGPYVLHLIEVRDSSENQVAAAVDAYTTTTYTANQFGPAPVAAIDATTYADAGLDADSDGLYDYLRVQLAVAPSEAGTYQLLATLRTQDRRYLAGVDVSFNLTSTTKLINLDFPGGLMRTLQADGPYRVESVSLLDEFGTTIDYLALAATTQPYSHTDFALPLVVLTGQYRDYAVDTGGSADADVLKIDVGLTPGNNGFVIAQGELTDKEGNNIAWVNSSVAVSAEVPATVTLVFSGTDILSYGVDGPYLLRNLLLYHTGDPKQDVTVSDAYITAPYDHTTLQPKFVIGAAAAVDVQVQPSTLPADGASSAAVVVAVEDADGHAIPNQVVQLASSKGSLSSSSATTGIDGTVAVSLTASTIAGGGVISASVGTVSDSANVTFLPGAPADLTLIVNPTKVSADGSSTISVTAIVRDEFGNTVAGQQVTFSATAGTIGDTAQTDSNGSAVTQLVAPKTQGTANVTASVGGLVQSAQVEFEKAQIFIPNLWGN
jgi:hypothetical protein